MYSVHEFYYHVTEKHEKCIPVQNVHGELHRNSNDSIIDSESDIESDFSIGK